MSLLHEGPPARGSNTAARTLAGLAVTAALIAGASSARAQCAPGRVVTPETLGRCCWPGQRWSAQYGRCDGPPQCPGGYSAAGDACVPNSASTPPTPPPNAGVRQQYAPPAYPSNSGGRQGYAPVAGPRPNPSPPQVYAPAAAPPPVTYAPPPTPPAPAPEPVVAPAAPASWSPPPGQTYYVWPPGVLTPPGAPLANAPFVARPVAAPPAMQPSAPAAATDPFAPQPAAPPPAAPPPAPPPAAQPPPAPVVAVAPAPAANTQWNANASIGSNSSGTATWGSTGGEPQSTTPPPPAPSWPAETPPAPPVAERREQPYDGGPVPPGAHVERRRSAALIATGATLFAVGWGVALGATLGAPAYCTYGFNGSGETVRVNGTWSATGWIPFAGGIIAAAASGCPRSPTASYMESSPGGGIVALAVLGSVVQIGGGVLFGLGLREHAVLVFEPRAALRDRTRPGRVAGWSLAPLATASALGVLATVQSF